jgi:hypothetical protein
MGIEGIDQLIRGFEEDRHIFIDFPVGSNLHGRSCVRCGRVRNDPIHIQDEEQKDG